MTRYPLHERTQPKPTDSDLSSNHKAAPESVPLGHALTGADRYFQDVLALDPAALRAKLPA